MFNWVIWPLAKITRIIFIEKILFTSSRIALLLLCAENKVMPFFPTRCCVCSVRISMNCLVICSARNIRTTKTELTLCKQFSALRALDVTGITAHGPESYRPQQTLNIWKVKTLSFIKGSCWLGLSRWWLWAPTQPYHSLSTAVTEHRGVNAYVMTCCTTVRSWEQPWFPQWIFLSNRRNLLGKFLLMYL